MVKKTWTGTIFVKDEKVFIRFESDGKKYDMDMTPATALDMAAQLTKKAGVAMGLKDG